MPSLTISSKYQIVLPKNVRDVLDLRPGQKLDAMVIDGHIQLIPVPPIRELRGMLAGMDTTVPREPDREL
jgi:AbrB family looped-hinge helix DNA binding protein